ncbi:hypothetical protein [Cellulomonas sp. Leaf395]|uniref:hypothetical protein n=1 Tax=Cellulomonas sp. Leaf395 TaxID=1736362 RepID=UPI0006F5AA76|nr:hypothetical protein [Cellulomonas sp. Leaf395]KQT01254.1 hypothetical protein ASG23_06675 [Cellulomonas sp. Leaf395]
MTTFGAIASVVSPEHGLRRVRDDHLDDRPPNRIHEYRHVIPMTQGRRTTRFRRDTALVRCRRHVGVHAERPPGGDQLGQCGRDAAAQRLDERAHELPAAVPVGFAVGADHALVDAPVASTWTLVDAKQVAQALVLALGEQVRAGVQSPAGAVERVGETAPARWHRCLR